MIAKILTANRLLDGISVWYSVNGEWEEKIRDGLIARHDEAVRALEAAGEQALADNRVVDVILIDVEETSSGIRPLRLRERIRADGPTIEYLPVSGKITETEAA